MKLHVWTPTLLAALLLAVGLPSDPLRAGDPDLQQQLQRLREDNDALHARMQVVEATPPPKLALAPGVVPKQPGANKGGVKPKAPPKKQGPKAPDTDDGAEGPGKSAAQDNAEFTARVRAAMKSEIARLEGAIVVAKQTTAEHEHRRVGGATAWLTFGELENCANCTIHAQRVEDRSRKGFEDSGPVRK